MKDDIDFSALKRTDDETTQQWVYRALRFAVISGQVQPGHALTIRGVASLLDVSAMPVREALRRLTSEGAVELKSNRRIMVPDLTPSKIAELIELRVVLEVHAAERALPYITADRLEVLDELNEEQNTAFGTQDLQGIILGNQAFHRALYSANPDPVTMPLIEQIWLQLGPLQRLAMANLEDSYETDRHVEIMQAIKTRNPYGLKIALEADIRDASGYMTKMELLEQYSRAENQELKIPGKDYMMKLAKRDDPTDR